MSDRTGIDTVLRQAADRGEVPGVVALAGTSQGATYEGAFGRRDLSKPDPMTPDTVFWIASMTKAIVSTAAMQMVERGRVGLDQNLGEILRRASLDHSDWAVYKPRPEVSGPDSMPLVDH